MDVYMLHMFHPGALLVVSSMFVGETISMISGHKTPNLATSRPPSSLLSSERSCSCGQGFCDSLIKFGVPKMTKIFGSNGHSFGYKRCYAPIYGSVYDDLLFRLVKGHRAWRCNWAALASELGLSQNRMTSMGSFATTSVAV